MLSKPSSSRLPVVRCRCGAKILLLANTKLMSEAIEAHVELHKKRVKNQADAEVEAAQIEDELITKVLSKACEV